MAQMQDTQQVAATGQTTSISKMTNLLGAAASLALMIGIGVWGYKLLMRDVSGVPVVRAAEGPMRVQPEDPGGQQAEHQGLSVNGVAAEGTAADPADRLMLAPAPLDLAEEDAVPLAELAPEQEQEATPAETPDASEFLEADDETVQLAAVERLAEQLSAGVEPLEELTPAPEAEEPASEEATDASAVEAAVAQAQVVEGGLGRSLRPKRRPAQLSNVQPVAAAADPGTGAVAEADPATIPAGTRLAQLGAYDSAATARSEWDRLQGRFGEYLEGKTRVVQKAASGGRTFYRLRVMGFDDLSDARRFCSALVAERAECIPVVTR